MTRRQQSGRQLPAPAAPIVDFDRWRVDVVRSLLTRALDQIEGAGAPTKRGGR